MIVAKYVSAALVAFAGAWFGGLAHAASESFCRSYAETALNQHQEAIALKAPGIVPPVWSSDYNAHYSWCLRVDQAAATSETQKRESVLSSYRSQQSDAVKAPEAPGATGAITGPFRKIGEGCIDPSALTSDASVASAISNMTYIDVAIITAGQAEQSVGLLPIPTPYPVADLVGQYRSISQSLILQRSHAIDHDTQRATQVKNELTKKVNALAKTIADRNANLPVPVPKPLGDLQKHTLNLQNQIAATPINVPAPANSATPINVPVFCQ